jgi:hypothetical protein
MLFRLDRQGRIRELRGLSTSCAQHLLTTSCSAFHVKQHRCVSVRPPVYPQAAQACDVVFHVKLKRLWITSVDNFWCVVTPTDGDVGERRSSRPNG